MIHNIIFDLGGVVLKIDYKLTERAFVQLGVTNFKDLYTKQHQIKLFDKFERGEINSNEFRQGIRDLADINLSDEQIDESWNKMLIELPERNLKYLQELEPRYRLFLLSNTNEIHIKGFTNIIMNQYGYMPFDTIFEKVYYSNVVGLRKPDVEIFNKVLHENGLMADNTLFIDDSEGNLIGAKSAGIKVVHMQTGGDLSSILKKFIH